MPNFALTPPLEDFIADKIRSGGYNNASEVVREALRIMQHRDAHLADLDGSLMSGLAEADRGHLRSSNDVLDDLGARFDNGAKDTRR